LVNTKGERVIQLLDLSVFLRYSLAHKEKRYFLEISGKGRSLDLKDMKRLRVALTKELAKRGVIVDPYKRSKDWIKNNKAKHRQAVADWKKRNPDKMKAINKRQRQRQEQIKEAKRRAAEMAKNPPDNILAASHEIRETETQEPISPFVLNR